ncbi:MAG: hypothetical protein AAB777_02130 [Patescibacteria group bacterium]
MNIPARSQFKSKHTGEQSREFINNRRKRIIWGCALGVAVAVSWLFVASNLTHLAVFDIQAINIKGADSNINNALEAAVFQAIQGNYFGLFSKSNSFIYPKKAIRQSLENSDTRVNNVIVSRNGLHSLDITVNEKTPAAVFCVNLPNWDGTLLSFDSLDSCYLVDGTGLAFMNASTSHIGINRYYMPNIANNTLSAGIIGIRVASTTAFRALQSFYNSARNYGIDVRALLVKGAGEYELYAGTDSGVIVVYFNEINGLDNELTALISFWNDVSQKTNGKNGKMKLDSIDLRYGSNIFYRIVR